MRDSFDFAVPMLWPGLPYAENAEPTHWLLPDGRRSTTNLVEALRLRFHTFTTGIEDCRISTYLDEINGGISGTVDLQVGVDNTTRALWGNLERLVFPDGREDDPPRSPEDQLMKAYFCLSAEEVEKLRLLEPKDQHFDPDNPLVPVAIRQRIALDRMHALRERQQVAACWRYLIVDAPEGWEDIATRPMPVQVRDAVIAAFVHYRSLAAEALGKAPPSDS